MSPSVFGSNKITLYDHQTPLRGGRIFSDVRIPKCLIHMSGNMIPTSTFNDQPANNFICSLKSEECSGIAMNKNFWLCLNVNLKPQYRYYKIDEDGVITPNITNRTWKTSKVELSIPNELWRSHTVLTPKVVRSNTEEDEEELENFFSTRGVYSVPTTSSTSNDRMINKYYLGAVYYPRRGMKKSKKVYSPVNGRLLLDKLDAMFRVGLYKKDMYDSFTDLYTFGKNQKFLLSPEEFQEMALDEKIE